MSDDGAADRWRRVSALLDAALDADEPGRTALLAAAGREDPALRREVEALLAAAAAAPPWLATPLPPDELIAHDAALEPAPDHRLGERVGAFRLVREIGRGGMGVVYLGERADGAFEQRVAVKLLRAGVGNERLGDALRRERQILARLEHPNVARLLDGGVTADGTPYFVMEHVEGEAITAFCERHALALEERLRLFLAVCAAVEAVHAQQVVHRDLKPSNVLVHAGAGGEHQVKLLDFGIAKLLDRGDGDQTQTAAWTPLYATPEQLRGEPVTPATDVYALGLLLFELLTGRRARGDGEVTAAAVVRTILEGEMPRPSTATTTPAVPARRLRGDLDDVVGQALERDPARRYPTVSLLAADVRRVLGGEPVQARGRSRTIAFRQRLRRHGAALLVGAAALLAVAAALLVVRSRAAGVAPPTASAFALLSAGDRSQGQPSLAPAGDAFAFVDTDSAGVPQVFVEHFGSTAERQVTSGPWPAACPRWRRDGVIVFERPGHGIWSVAASGGAARLLVSSGSNPNVSGDGRWLVFERLHGGVWRARADGSGAPRIVTVPEIFYSTWIDRHPALSPDGSQVAYFVALAGAYGDFWVAPVERGAPRRVTFDYAEGGTPAWTPDGRALVVSSSRDGARTLWLVPLDGGAPRPLTVGGGDDAWPDISADGTRLVYASRRASYAVTLRDTRTGADRELAGMRQALLEGPAISPRGDRIAFFGGHRAGAVQIFTVRTDGSELRPLTPEDGWDRIEPQWSADGQRIYFYLDGPSGWRVSSDGTVLTHRDDRPKPDFRVMPVNGGRERILLRDWTWERQEWLRLDAAGRRGAYTRWEGDTPRATFVRDMVTGAERPLPRVLLHVDWAPDGRSVVGVTAHGNGEALRCAIDGGCIRLGPAALAVWQRDGRAVLLGREGPPRDDPQLVDIEVTAVDPDGGGERRVATLGPVHRDCDAFSAGPDASLAWIVYRAGPQEIWSARLERAR